MSVVSSISAERFVSAVSAECDCDVSAHTFGELISVQHRKHVKRLPVGLHNAWQQGQIHRGKLNFTVRQVQLRRDSPRSRKIWICVPRRVVSDRKGLDLRSCSGGMERNSARIDTARKKHPNRDVRDQVAEGRLSGAIGPSTRGERLGWPGKERPGVGTSFRVLLQVPSDDRPAPSSHPMGAVHDVNPRTRRSATHETVS